MRWILIALLMAPAAMGQEVFDPFDPTDDDEQMGVAVGAKIPDFAVEDQHGNVVTFDTLKGENGAVLLFHRSADW